MGTPKLKDPRICRIFFSSPFNGMEGERQDFTKLYWPRIESLCAARGLQFRAVDMRWGITSESSDDAQTINICLREIDRSDIFVGFFGQRYGWHGENDEALQKNFEKALDLFPWIEKFRDRSVTELEFLHGHLNDPGSIPACIAFRSKAFDDAKREEGVKNNNKREIYKYSSESEVATARMDDLKRRVKLSEHNTIGINMAYEDPSVGAKFMFDSVWKYMTEVLFAAPPGQPLSPRQVALAHHDAFMSSRTGLYVGGKDYINRLEEFVTGESRRGGGTKAEICAIYGEGGTGKSALVSNWLSHRKQTSTNEVIVYHFVGCASGSTGLAQVLNRINTEIREAFSLDQSSTDASSSADAARDFLDVLEKAGSQPDRTLVVIVDGINRVEATGKLGKPLFWIPKELPKNVKMVLSTLESQFDDLANALGNEEKTGRLVYIKINHLQVSEKIELCLETLKEHSKELTKDQLDMVVQKESTRNPLFLKIVIDELRVFGSFRKLAEKIQSLVSCVGVRELFTSYLARLEEEHTATESQRNIIKEVLVSIRISRYGLSETEITTLLDIPPGIWSSVYFALEKYLINRVGLLGLAFDELGEAVDSRYLTNEKQRKEATMRLADFFFSEFEENVKGGIKIKERVVNELPYLLKRAKDNWRLYIVITNLDMFTEIIGISMYELFEYWDQWTSEKIAEVYLKAIDNCIAKTYTEHLDSAQHILPVEAKVYRIIATLITVMDQGKYHKGLVPVINRALRILSSIKNMSAEERSAASLDQKYRLACVYCELEMWDDSRQLHQEVLQARERSHEDTDQSHIDVGDSYHGVGTVCIQTGQYDQAEEYFINAITWFRKANQGKVLHICNSISNLGNVHIARGNYKEAIEQFQNVLELQEKYYFGQLPPHISYTLLNMALCYRRLGDNDSAEKLYKRSLQIKEAAFGYMHQDVALTLLNLGALEVYRNNNEKALQYTEEAVRIFETTVAEDHTELIKAKENLTARYLTLGMYEKAEPLFWNAFNYRQKKLGFKSSIASVMKSMMRYHVDRKQYAQAEAILVELLPLPGATGEDFYVLAKIDSFKPPEERPQRPYNLSMDAGLERFPTEFSLWSVKLYFDLIPNKDVSKLIQHAERFYKAQNEAMGAEDPVAGGEAYYEVAKALLDNGMAPEAVTVLQEGHKAVPDHPEIWKWLAIALPKVGRAEEGFSYLRRVAGHTRHPVLLLNTATQAISVLNDVVLARHYLTTLQSCMPQDEDNLAKQVTMLDETITQLEEQQGQAKVDGK